MSKVIALWGEADETELFEMSSYPADWGGRIREWVWKKSCKKSF
jgi:hypothetical protein